MTRQASKSDNKNENVTVVSNAPLDPLPELGMTPAAAAAAPTSPQLVGEAAALQEAEPNPEAPPLKWYRVLNDKQFTSITGFRATMRAGKEINETMYNIQSLIKQGIKLEEIESPV